ncbi:MAG: YitT family protein [Coprobacillus sp.]|nr:YitT family protein [Coprobacillus sp.]
MAEQETKKRWKDKYKEMTRRQKVNMYLRWLLVIVGCFVLAFGTATFFTELNIVAGGLSGIGIIIQAFVPEGYEVIDITVFVLTWILWALGFIFLGREFALKTLMATIVYPLALALFLRVPFFQNLSVTMAGDGGTADILINCIFGGLCTGAGVALTFLGGGSSGGVDVIAFILEKYTGLKQSIGSFICDAIIIVIGIFVIPDNIIPGLCGIISAFLCALMIQFIYISNLTAYQVDIISDHYLEISQYVQDELGRGATIIDAKGGYHGDDRPILRVVVDRSQRNALRDYIAKVDPKAFTTFTQTSAVLGEGFREYPKPRTTKKNTKNEENNQDLEENNDENGKSE